MFAPQVLLFSPTTEYLFHSELLLLAAEILVFLYQNTLKGLLRGSTVLRLLPAFEKSAKTHF